MRSAYIKKILFIVLVMCALAQMVFADEHLYHTGILSDKAIDRVIIAGKSFVLQPRVKVVVKYKDRGAYYEKIGRFSDVRLGDRVYLKAIGNIVSEIVVMR